MLRKYFESEMEYALMDPIIFGDYWAAGTEEEVVYYEDMQDYEVCKAIAEEVWLNSMEFEDFFPSI